MSEDLKAGVVALSENEYSPNYQYLQAVFNVMNMVSEAMIKDPSQRADDLRIRINPVIKMCVNEKIQKEIENSLTGLVSKRVLESKLIESGISENDYKNNPDKKAKVDSTNLSDTKLEYCKKLALQDMLGIFVSKYLGPKYDVDGYKMSIMICTLRNDKDILVSTKNLSEDERERLKINTLEKIMRED